MNVVSKNKPLRFSERGATMVEYSLMASLIAVVMIAAVTYVGERTGASFMKAGEELAKASDSIPLPPPPPPPP